MTPVDATEGFSLDAWRNDQVARTYCHAPYQGGSFSRLLAYIALHSTPENPWVSVPARISGAVFKNANRANGSSMISRMLRSGHVVERKTTPRGKRTDVRELRLNLSCNPLCGDGEHAFDATYADVLRWLGGESAQFEALLGTLGEREAATYRHLLRESSRLDLKPSPCHLTDSEGIVGLLQRRLIQERDSTDLARFVPVADVLAGGDD